MNFWLKIKLLNIISAWKHAGDKNNIFMLKNLIIILIITKFYKFYKDKCLLKSNNKI
jgi:hypothetical protein